MNKTNALLAIGCLAVSAHRLGVASLPGSSVGTTDGVVGSVALDTQTSVLLAGGGKTASFSVLVNRRNNPIDTGVVSNGNVVRINQNNFVVLVGGILVNPVRVEHSHVHGVATSALLSDGTKVASILELVDTLVLGLTEHNTLGVGSLAATAANSDTKDGVALLGLVAELVGLVGSGRTSHLLNLLALAVLPGSFLLQNNGYRIKANTKINFSSRKNNYLTRSRKRRASLCFFLQISSRYL